MARNRMGISQRIYYYLAQMGEADLASAGEMAWDHLCRQPRQWTFRIAFASPLVLG